ncbi:hypothetical protein GMES_1823 [Paraglaciecola mesophila KMM 241]|uniref:Uncharacterized protein n=1 Tax=Paraglaciecola mesophila KMM 241 TaxID=1128912 RepID=K6XU17_9ALTE|nr:hypothetical protein GMES_1823 [Paraglaciecola mesophila KMM 241]
MPVLNTIWEALTLLCVNVSIQNTDRLSLKQLPDNDLRNGISL